MSPCDLAPGSPVILYLQGPKEKVWGILLSIGVAGIVVRGLDLAVFDDWMRQETRADEPLIGPSTIFYPIGRLERMEVDETVGPVTSYAERFAREVGRTVLQVMGLDRAGLDHAAVPARSEAEPL
jgi:hypothetical protein